MKEVYIIDGAKFCTFEQFVRHFSERVFNNPEAWHGDLDAFNDMLRGGFGTPSDGFILRWINSSASRQCLGYPATLLWLDRAIKRCHPSAIPHFRARQNSAQKGQGETLFDNLVDIIRIHCAGGDEEDDGVELELL